MVFTEGGKALLAVRVGTAMRVRARPCECAASGRLFINADKQSEAELRVTSRACCAVCLFVSVAKLRIKALL